tara:strand:+ start:2225 stop:2374 length:150 start_codon:yes stop_codon:yes gene_type:complete
MIYFTDKDGNTIGKKSPTSAQKKDYKDRGFQECNENGKPITKAKKLKKK